MSVGSRNSTPQQKTFYPDAANRSAEVRTVPPNGRDAISVGTSSEVNQSSSSTIPQTPVSDVRQNESNAF